MMKTWLLFFFVVLCEFDRKFSYQSNGSSVNCLPAKGSMPKLPKTFSKLSSIKKQSNADNNSPFDITGSSLAGPLISGFTQYCVHSNSSAEWSIKARMSKIKTEQDINLMHQEPAQDIRKPSAENKDNETSKNHCGKDGDRDGPAEVLEYLFYEAQVKSQEFRRRKVEIGKLKDLSKYFNISVTDHKKPWLLGEGSFGRVYAGTSKFENEKHKLVPVAIKIALPQDRSTRLKGFVKRVMHPVAKYQPNYAYEADMLVRLKGVKGVIEIIAYGSYNRKEAIVLPMLDISLLDAFIEYVEREQEVMPLPVAYAIFEQAIDTIEGVHAKGIIHRDIKPDNFLFNGNQLILTDFGLSKRIDEKIEQEKGKCVGTADFISLRASDCRPLGKIDDLTSLMYLAIFLRCGGLPWSDKKPVEIRREKQKLQDRVLDVRKHPTVALNYGPQKCHVDNEIRLCLQYVSNTSVDEIPPYDKCRVLFKEARMANDIRSLWSN